MFTFKNYVLCLSKNNESVPLNICCILEELYKKKGHARFHTYNACILRLILYTSKDVFAFVFLVVYSLYPSDELIVSLSVN